MKPIQEQSILDIFIPYDSAHDLVKKLGFNQPCLAFYDAYNGGNHLFLKPRTNYHWFFKLFVKNEDNEVYFKNQDQLEYEEGDNALLAPTYTQAFEFFRKKFNIDSELVIKWEKESGNSKIKHLSPKEVSDICISNLCAFVIANFNN